MTIIIDYSTLQTAIADTLLRSDLTSVIPRFIQLAEQRLKRDPRLLGAGGELKVDVPIVIGQSAFTLPANLQEVRSVLTPFNTGLVSLRYETPTVFFEKQDNYYTPTAYTVVGENLHIAPPASEASTVTLVYTGLPALSVVNPTNWLLTDSADIYLYAALAESAPYLDHDDRIVTWVAILSDRLNAYKILNERRKYLGAPLVRPARRIG